MKTQLLIPWLIYVFEGSIDKYFSSRLRTYYEIAVEYILD